MPNNRIIISDRAQVRYGLRANPIRNATVRKLVKAGAISVNFTGADTPIIIVNLDGVAHMSFSFDSDDLIIDGLPSYEKSHFVVELRSSPDAAGSFTLTSSKRQPLNRQGRHIELLEQKEQLSLKEGLIELNKTVRRIATLPEESHCDEGSLPQYAFH